MEDRIPVPDFHPEVGMEVELYDASGRLEAKGVVGVVGQEKFYIFSNKFNGASPYGNTQRPEDFGLKYSWFVSMEAFSVFSAHTIKTLWKRIPSQNVKTKKGVF